MAETKAQKLAKARKLKVTPAVTQFQIPAICVYEVLPLELASNPAAGDAEPDAILDAVTVGDNFIAVRRQGCDETFIVARSTLDELLKETA